MNREEAARILDPSTSDIEFEKDISHWSERLDIARAMGAEALRSPWVKTADRLPTEADANKESKVLGWIPGYGYRGADYKFVIGRPEHVTWWMPFPSRLEVEE